MIAVRENRLPRYHCRIIEKKEEIAGVPVLEICNYQWSHKYMPKAYGKIAYLEGCGLLVHMTSEEVNPLRRYTQDDDPVYKDSALEFFVSFPCDARGYLNIEVNALGAVLNGYGKDGVKYKLADITNLRPKVSVRVNEIYWEVEILIPEELLKEIFKFEKIDHGTRFTCNLYKISEEPEIEHYGSWSRIDSMVPNFHLPEYFGEVLIVGDTSDSYDY